MKTSLISDLFLVKLHASHEPSIWLWIQTWAGRVRSN